ncbi:carbohydrate esterase family 4 protein [Sclerotinia borealis F-4128]|uniref:chitin deacetylase n=1 Tax=Sclerotinia borealis (strain F-4128) TaxID=1432307 RepID=W9CX69_SCLBF|nr:carbohydrate esterase family 4 protein [Sclerotinia borealis F-4128]
MRLSIGALIRRVQRLGFSSWSTPGPTKHVKIDDEERGVNFYELPARKQDRSSFSMIKMIFLVLLGLLFLVLLFAYIIYKPPQFIINYLQWKYPSVLFHLPLSTSHRVIALTIDDAPSEETDRILDLLKIYNAKATFFIIGSQISSHPEIIQRIHDEGHEVGNHAWADEPSISLPLSELERQIQEVEDLLPINRPITGSKIPPKYFRPGSGFFNAQMLEMAKGLGYRVVLGSIYPHDPQIHHARINARHILSMARPGGIIIMHDRRSYSAAEIELVLGGLKKRKFRVESLGGLLGVAGINQAV